MSQRLLLRGRLDSDLKSNQFILYYQQTIKFVKWNKIKSEIYVKVWKNIFLDCNFKNIPLNLVFYLNQTDFRFENFIKYF